jgi:hypothetical protein
MKKPTRSTRPKLPPEMRAAYKEIEGGVRDLGKSITQIQQGLLKAERRIEADAKARIAALRRDAKAQLAGLRVHERDAARTLKSLAAAAGESWQDVKQSADGILTEAKATAASVIERFRSALGA